MNLVDLKYQLLDLIVLAVGFGVPVYTYRGLRRWLGGRQDLGRFLPVAAAVLLSAALVPPALVWMMCGGPPPGQGGAAQRAYERAAPVIVALETYQAQYGGYPDRLEQLVPAMLPASALRLPRRSGESYPLLYQLLRDDYTLTFRYSGPGMNECTYSGAHNRWSCRGYF